MHPVAVTLARVTWLLALGDLVADRPAKLTVPVFLGDAMQWNLRRYVDGADVLVEVPGEDRPLANTRRRSPRIRRCSSRGWTH